MKQNQARINELIKAALDLEQRIDNFKVEYDGTGVITDECLRQYDLLEYQISGLYHRIGQLVVGQEIGASYE